MRFTGVGSMPGEDYAEALRLIVGEVAEEPGLPFVPELPARGVAAGMVGRALALVPDLGVDLQPAGWRLTGSTATSGVDHRRARSLLAQDLDGVEEAFGAYAGPLKTQVAGPWTLAATVERPRGDKLLADHGARRDLAQALAEGVTQHVRDLRRRIAGLTTLIVQIDEPVLAAVLGARVPTASGFGRHRSIDRPELTEALGWVLAAVAGAGAEPWVHSCEGDAPLDLVRMAGSRGLVVDLARVGAPGYDVLAEALEAGESVGLGVVPSTDPGVAAPTATALAERVLRWLDMMGLDPESVGDRVVITGSCGFAGASPSWMRQALALARDGARNLQ
ncbi:methionine synthase [Nocardioides sp. R-C-SC26]|uniref:methionine synthase n=1 Tax=Nocardioides sp. R-C-SC26 TaxID=2870414 RepID=UPI001E42B05D|nr:methionine synthase [Nocardioides sp. R-C-SC26]